MANRKAYTGIIIVSVLVPLLIALLMAWQNKSGLGDWVKVLPHFNAILNTSTAIALLFGLVMIKRKEVMMHRIAMSASFILGVFFLVSYITYHSSVPSVIFGDLDGDGLLSDFEKLQLGSTRAIYLFLLLSHIVLSIVVVPFVLFAFYYALSDQIDRHRKIVKFTWPIWFYVSVSGVLVYLMISPYYQ